MLQKRKKGQAICTMPGTQERLTKMIYQGHLSFFRQNAECACWLFLLNYRPKKPSVVQQLFWILNSLTTSFWVSFKLLQKWARRMPCCGSRVQLPHRVGAGVGSLSSQLYRDNSLPGIIYLHYCSNCGPGSCCPYPKELPTQSVRHAITDWYRQIGEYEQTMRQYWPGWCWAMVTGHKEPNTY